MDAPAILSWLHETDLATLIRQHGLLFPVLESLHVLAIALLLGAIAIVDLHLIGARLVACVRPPLGELLRLTWVAFTCSVLTGAAMFAADPMTYFNNGPFRIKLLLLVLAAINALVFHRIGRRGLRQPGRPAFAGRLAGAVSLMLWVTIVACGRWIGFVSAE